MMKKLLVIACVMAMVMGIAGAAGAYTIQGGPTANSGGTFMISTVNDNLPSPVNDTVVVFTWFALTANQNWAGGSDPGALNQRVFDTTPPAQWTFAAYVESAVQNPSLTILVYGPQLDDVVGQTWALRNKTTGAILASNTWTASMTSADNYLFSYTFADTSGMVGRENALALTLGQVPEPGSMVAMLSGLVGLAGFGIRRRK